MTEEDFIEVRDRPWRRFRLDHPRYNGRWLVVDSNSGIVSRFRFWLPAAALVALLYAMHYTRIRRCH